MNRRFGIAESLHVTGRIFFGVAIIGIGLQSLYFADLPYMLLPPANVHAPEALAFAFGIILAAAGAGIVFVRKSKLVSTVLGLIFLAIVCLFLVPYEFISGSNYAQLAEWENAEKTLALAGGAFTIAGFSGKAGRIGPVIFGLMMIGFGILHFVYAGPASGYIPSWIPFHLFWMYFCGAALLGSGISIVCNIRPGLFAALLGLMIFIWFVSLHIPKVVNAAPAGLAGEMSSAFLALAYCGIAFFIAGTADRKAARLH